MQPVLRSRRRAVRVRRARSSDKRRRAVRVRQARSRLSRWSINDRASRSTIASRDLVDRAVRSTIAPLVGAVRSSAQRRDLGSLSLFFRKLFEVKMRGETDFRVKGENIGQPKVIFRKMIFSVTAKHAENGENDFLKSFSPKTNAP